MPKRTLVVGFMLVSLLITTTVNASSHKNAAHFLNENAMVAGFFSIPDGLRKYVEQYLTPDEFKPAATHLLFNKFKAGETMHVGIPQTPEQSFLMFEISEAEWQDLINDETPSTTYENVAIYSDGSGGHMAYIDGLLVAAQTQEAISSLIDASKGASLAQNVTWQKVNSNNLSGSFLNVYFNLSPLKDLLEAAFANQPEPPPVNFTDLFKFLEQIGISAAKTSTGYNFKFSVYGNETFLTSNNFEFDKTGSFVPSLYKKFSNNPALLYSESFNAKANADFGDRFLNHMFGEEFTAMLSQAQEQFETETGWNLEEDVYSFLDQELAFAVQYDNKHILPYVTFMANVANTRAKGAAFLEKIEALIDEARAEAGPGIFKKGTHTLGGAEMTLYMIDPTKDEFYEGPPLEPIPLLLGITEDNTLVITTDALKGANFFEDGLGGNAEFSTAYQNKTEAVIGISYFSPRTLWTIVDNFIGWVEDVSGGEHGPPLDFYRGYYAMLDVLYQWKNLFMTTKASTAEMHVKGSIQFDNAAHQTYDALVSQLQSADSDGDGVSDFDERFRYNTYGAENDSDSDGVTDFEEVKAGLNPNGEGQLFKDVPEDQWYQEDVGELYLRGTVKGYDDQTFRPGADVTRREFTAMVTRAFTEDFEKTFGFSLTPTGLGEEASPFIDVSKNDWAYEYIVSAKRLKFIGGYSDGTFKPDNPISRAEAVAILNKVSATMKQSGFAFGVEVPENCRFNDVDTDQWFAASVNNACVNGVTQGKKPGEFRPLDNLTRAEAAVLIQRTLDIDFQNFAEKEASGGELFAPLAPSAAKLF